MVLVKAFAAHQSKHDELPIHAVNHYEGQHIFFDVDKILNVVEATQVKEDDNCHCITRRAIQRHASIYRATSALSQTVFPRYFCPSLW